MCLIFLLLLLGPRFILFVLWLLQPARISLAFDGFVLPLLGLIFLPWTTLAFLFVSPTGDIVGTDFLWLGIAFAIDISSLIVNASKSKSKSN